MFNLRRKPRVRVWKVYTDGAIQPLYGISGVGAVVYDETGKIVHLWQGVARGMTCNEAEYTAVLFALRRLEAFRPLRLTVCSDSQVLVDQMTGMAQVHAPELRRLNFLLRGVVLRFGEVQFQHVPREQNRIADALAVEAVMNLKASQKNLAEGGGCAA